MPKHTKDWNDKISDSVRKSWFNKSLPKRRCLSCKSLFLPTGRRHKYCGSINNTQSCSYKREREMDKRLMYKCNYRFELIKLRRNCCEHCGIKNDNPSFFDIDHIKPIKRTQNNLPHNNYYKETEKLNLQVLCPNCHRIKTIINSEF